MPQKISGAKTSAAPRPRERQRVAQPGEGCADGLARVLKKTGSFYYHCDWHASHYVKVMLDQIFGNCKCNYA
jgi:hypothetical protein